MRILVTGGSGLVGRVVVRHLSDNNDVTVLDIVEPKESGMPFVRGDVLDFESMRKLVNNYDAVAHLAAIPYPPKDAYEKTFRLNVMGTFNVLDACAVNGIRRIVFTSSDSTIGLQYGRRTARAAYLPVDEDHPALPEDAYGLSKLVCEEMCRSYARGHGMNITVLRPVWVWGKNEHVAGYRKSTEHPEEWPQGLWSYIHDVDVARAVEAGFQTTWESGCEVFFIAAANNGTKFPTRELISRFIPEVTDLRAPLENHDSLINTAKAKRMLGWQPEHTWEEIV